MSHITSPRVPSLPRFVSLGLPVAVLTRAVCVTCVLGAANAASAPARGSLRVDVDGAEHDRGQVIVKLFRKGDAVPQGKGFREARLHLRGGAAVAMLESLPYGDYALFAFHDENGNGTVDHNFLGFPIEPLAFSAGFRVSIASGIPDFEDLKFAFDAKRPKQRLSFD